MTVSSARDDGRHAVGLDVAGLEIARAVLESGEQTAYRLHCGRVIVEIAHVDHLGMLSDSISRKVGLADSLCSRNVPFMPEHLPPIRFHPSKRPRTLRDAAADGMVVEQWCNLCRRRVTYLASDLLHVSSPEHPMHEPVFPCGQCGTIEYVNTRCRVPRQEEYGTLIIRRPLRRVWKWGNGQLGE